jgi:hypothetical protein
MAPQEFDAETPIDSLHEHPSNPNLGDVGAIAESLDQHGFYGAVLVQASTGRIVAGNHRYRAAKAKGAATLPAFKLDIDDDEAERILAIDNRTTHLATMDEGKLIDLLQTAKKNPRGLAGTGYPEDALAALLRHHHALEVKATDPVDEWEGMPDFDQPGARAAYSVTMHFPAEEDAERFFALIGAERPARKYLWWPHVPDDNGPDYSVMEVQDDGE